MMGHRQVEQAALFYEFSLEKHIPADHLLRSVDRFVDLQEIRQDLAPFYSSIGRPSIDPELMIRMLLVGYCFGIRPKPSKDGQADPDAQAEARIEAVEQFGQVATELLQLNTAGLFQQNRPVVDICRTCLAIGLIVP